MKILVCTFLIAVCAMPALAADALRQVVGHVLRRKGKARITRI